MKSKRTTAFPASTSFFLPPLFGLFVLGSTAKAQQELAQPPAPPVESTSQLAMTNSFQLFPVRPAPTAPQPYEPFRWDQFVIRPHFDYQFVDAYHVLAAPSNQVDTTIQQISPGVLLNLGPHWALDYTATIGIYSNTNFGREFDNGVTLTGQTDYGDWILAFMQTILLTSSPLIEFGGQTQQEYYNTALTGHHKDSQYVSEDLGVYQNIQVFPGDGFEDMRSWSTVDWLNYQPQSHFNIGISPGLGYDNAEYGPDSAFEEAQARVNWRLNNVLSLQLSGGVVETEFLGGQGNGDLFSPIYGAVIQFQPFTSTEISLYGNRSVSPSAFVGQFTETSSLGCSVSQRFLGQFYVSVAGAYSDEKYVASSTDVTAGRTDDYYTFSVHLSHSFLERGQVSLFYQYNSDKSTAAGYTFSGNQFGAEVSYSF